MVGRWICNNDLAVPGGEAGVRRSAQRPWVSDPAVGRRPSW